MQITCLGASRAVSPGSSFLLDNGNKYLIDCGLFQGGKQIEALNHKPWPFDPQELSAVFLTHAHIDHCGRLPKLVKDGFRGKIYCTLPTAELCKILLLDSAHIQEMDAEWLTRKNRRGGEGEVKPLYTVEDAAACSPLFEPVEKDEPMSLNGDLKVSFRTSGHILGAASLEVWSGTGQDTRKIVFSGDVGYRDQLIVQDPESISAADILFVESTYGNRNHKSFEESRKELLEAIHFSYNHHEKVIIPAFAVERTQELLYIIGEFFRQKLIPPMPVYVDSPLAIAATDIFRRMKEFYDVQTRAIINGGNDPFNFPELVFSKSSQESIAINDHTGPAIVIAGNGMCTAGRIKHHLKHNIWRPGSSVVIVGFQAEGTLGRRLIEGAQFVKVLGERVAVRAKVFTIGGFSAHADRAHLLEWIGHFKQPGMQVYVVHGEPRASEEFAENADEPPGVPGHRAIHRRRGYMGSHPSCRPGRRKTGSTAAADQRDPSKGGTNQDSSGTVPGSIAAGSAAAGRFRSFRTGKPAGGYSAEHHGKNRNAPPGTFQERSLEMSGNGGGKGAASETRTAPPVQSLIMFLQVHLDRSERPLGGRDEMFIDFLPAQVFTQVEFLPVHLVDFAPRSRQEDLGGSQILVGNVREQGRFGPSARDVAYVSGRRAEVSYFAREIGPVMVVKPRIGEEQAFVADFPRIGDTHHVLAPVCLLPCLGKEEVPGDRHEEGPQHGPEVFEEGKGNSPYGNPGLEVGHAVQGIVNPEVPLVAVHISMVGGRIPEHGMFRKSLVQPVPEVFHQKKFRLRDKFLIELDFGIAPSRSISEPHPRRREPCPSQTPSGPRF